MGSKGHTRGGARKREDSREKLERLDLALRSAELGVWHYDIVNNRREFDEQSLRLLGLHQEKYAGTAEEFFNIVHPDDRKYLRAALARTIEQDAPYQPEYRVPWPDGSVRYITERGMVMRDYAGRAIRMHGIHSDITERKRAERALAESEERLKLTLDAANVIAWEVNVDGSHHESGPVHRLFGMPAGFSHPGVADLFQSIHPEDRDRMQSLMQSALRGEREYHAEFRVPLDDGSVRWIEATGMLLQDDSGNPLRLLGIARDVTKRRDAEEGQRESETRTRNILRTVPIGMHMYRLDPDGSLIFTGANPAADRIVGIDHRDLVGKTLEEAFPPLRETEIPLRYREAASDGKDWHTEHITYEDRAIKGAYEVHAFQISPGHMVAAFEDITERKKTEEAVRQSEERFKRLFQNSNDIICLLDENGVHTSTSGPLERFTGYTPEDLTGRNAFDLIHPEDVEGAKAAFEDVVRRGRSGRMVEYRYRKKDGTWASMEAVGTDLLGDPAVKAVVVTIRDISERKRLQDQLQQAMKMEAIGRLAGGVAHDFNNILTVISGNIDLVRRHLNPSDPLLPCIDQVMKASESAASLTRQLLAFSRKQIIEPKVLNLNELVGNIRQMLGRLIGETITLQTVLGDDLGSVRVDPGQFEQVLVNLAVNARDAMPEGGTLTIETGNVLLDQIYCADRPGAQPGHFVRLAVRDTGHGMSDEVKEHLFEPFFTTKSKGHGTGLGLATIFGAVQQAGGFIDVVSGVGAGTTFVIHLPLIEMKAEKLTKARKSMDLSKGSETILLVEDEENVRQVALTILKELGYRPIEARDGAEALIQAEKHGWRIDLLMTDVVMPGMNGRELSERMLRQDPGMKVLFTSGYTDDMIVHHGVIEEDLNFIGKPYSMRALASKIREVLDAGK